MGVVTGCSPQVWARDQTFWGRELSVLRGRNDAGENESQTAQEPPVAGGSGQEQIHIVEEDHEQTDDAQSDHQDRQPSGARGMDRARTRGVTGGGRRALVGDIGRLLGRTTLWGDAAAGAT